MYTWTCICTYTWMYIYIDMCIFIYTHAYVIRLSASQYNTKCLSVVPRATMAQTCLEHVLGYTPEVLYTLHICIDIIIGILTYR